MKKLAMLGVVMLSALIGCAAAQAPPVNTAVVQLRAPDGLSYCSGFVIDAVRRYVMTADHCMDVPFQPTVDGSPALEFFHDPDLDIAIIFVPNLKDRDALKPAMVSPRAEAVVLFLGYVKESFVRIDGKVIIPEAIFANPAESSETFGPVVVFSPTVIPGMSGGPILNVDGLVIGVNRAGREAPSLSISAPVRLILVDAASYWPHD